MRGSHGERVGGKIDFGCDVRHGHDSRYDQESANSWCSVVCPARFMTFSPLLTESLLDWPADLDERIALSMRWDQHRLTRSWKTVQQLRSQQKPFDQSVDEVVAGGRKIDPDMRTAGRRYAEAGVRRRACCRSPPSVRNSWPPFATIRSSSCAAKRARGNRPSCRRFASKRSRCCRDDRPHPVAESPLALSQPGWPRSSRSSSGHRSAIRSASTMCRVRVLIKLMTDGILLAETQNDRYLDRYDTIIIDERMSDR